MKASSVAIAQRTHGIGKAKVKSGGGEKSVIGAKKVNQVWGKLAQVKGVVVAMCKVKDVLNVEEVMEKHTADWLYFLLSVKRNIWLAVMNCWVPSNSNRRILISYSTFATLTNTMFRLVGGAWKIYFFNLPFKWANTLGGVFQYSKTTLANTILKHSWPIQMPSSPMTWLHLHPNSVKTNLIIEVRTCLEVHSYQTITFLWGLLWLFLMKQPKRGGALWNTVLTWVWLSHPVSVCDLTNELQEA